MTETNYRVYAYRWVILAVFMFVNLTIQILWICFAPIASIAARFYAVNDLQIGLLAMIFMIVYVPLSLPISWAIDTWGYRRAVSLGCLLLAGFGLLRGIFAENYTLVVLATIGLAVSQPFFLNAVTKVAARWFPIRERATASGLALVASFLGIAVGQVVSPLVTLQFGIPTMLRIFGGLAAFSALVFILFTREAPPTPPDAQSNQTRALVLDGLKSMLKMRDIWLLLWLFLVGMGIFNGISTWIDGIVAPKGITGTGAGDLGGALLIGGIAGAAVLPALSDKLGQRKVFLFVGVLLAIPGLLGVIYATPFWAVAVSMFLLGFFLMSLAPIGYQYAAEITYPAPEGTSNGLLNLAGQVSVVFIYAMAFLKDLQGSFTFSLLILTALLAVSSVLVLGLRESTLLHAKAADLAPVSAPEQL